MDIDRTYLDTDQYYFHIRPHGPGIMAIHLIVYNARYKQLYGSYLPYMPKAFNGMAPELLSAWRDQMIGQLVKNVQNLVPEFKL